MSYKNHEHVLFEKLNLKLCNSCYKAGIFMLFLQSVTPLCDFVLINLFVNDMWGYMGVTLTGYPGLWKDILVALYRALMISSLHGGTTEGFGSMPIWWNEISLIGSKEEDISDWFINSVIIKVWPSKQTSF